MQTHSSLRIDNIRTRSLSSACTILRPDIRASAEKILYTFLLKGAKREIDLPLNITVKITKSIEESCYDLEIFESAKIYTFKAIECYEFPKFLDYKGMGNLVQLSRIYRLVIGLFAMFGGFWAGFIFILLDTKIEDRYWVSIFSPP